MAEREHVRNLMVNFLALMGGTMMAGMLQVMGGVVQGLSESMNKAFGGGKDASDNEIEEFNKKVREETPAELIEMIEEMVKESPPHFDEQLEKLGEALKDPVFDEGVRLARNLPGGMPDLSKPQKAETIAGCVHLVLSGDDAVGDALGKLKEWADKISDKFPEIKGPEGPPPPGD